MKTALTALLLAMAAACSKPVAVAPAPVPAPPPPAKEAKPPAAEMLSYKTPPEWISEEPANQMRKAQYKIPARKGKSEPAALTLFTFGGPAASLEGNIERWREQMGGGDASVSKIEGSACPATIVDIAGNYSGDDRGKPMENARLLVAVVEAGERTWYFKFVGPADTVDGWRDAFLELLKGVRPIE